MEEKKKHFFKYTEKDMESALNAVRNENLGIRKAARNFGVPHSTLINKLKCKVPEKRRMGPNTYLSEDEENLICNWVLANSRKGFPLNRRCLKETVSEILKNDNRQTPFKDNMPGDRWLKSFMKRHPVISERNAECINTARAAVSEDQIRNWFQELKLYLAEENALDILEDPTRIFNADESGFRTSPDNGLVLGMKGDKNFYEIKSGRDKECITVMANFSAAGKIVPPMVVYSYERIPAEIARNLNPNWGIGRSKSGWMTGQIFFGYIGNNFLPWLKSQGIKFPVLFLIDGHRSHLTLQVSTFCKENQIFLYAFLPNATHILQPADVSVFGPLKDGWQKIVYDWKRQTHNKAVSKALFGPLLEYVFKEKCTEDTIKNGFRKCGLYPFNPDAVDYGKCMSNATRTKDQSIDAMSRISKFGITELLYLESKMKTNRAEEFRECSLSGLWTGEESAKELFYVWKKIRDQVFQAITEKGQTGEEGHEDTNLNHQIQAGAQPTISSSNEDISNGHQQDQHLLNEQPHSETQPTIPIISLVSGPSENEQNNPVPDKGNSSVGKDVNSPSTSGTKGRTISPAFHQHILWPTDSPRKGNGRKRERLPHAATSKEWLRYWESKENEKCEKESAKVARKLALEEKRKTSNQKKSSSATAKNTKKSKKAIEEDWVCSVCSSSWNDEDKSGIPKKWLQCDQCSKQQHISCIPKAFCKRFGLSDKYQDFDEDFICENCFGTTDSEANDDSSNSEYE